MKAFDQIIAEVLVWFDPDHLNRFKKRFTVGYMLYNSKFF